MHTVKTKEYAATIKEIEKIYFSKVKSNAVIPTKRGEDGCYDIYACFEEDFIEIKPQEIKMIPTGIASAFSPKYRVGLRERGSTGTVGMAYRSGQIDSGYRGEWFVPINNTTNKTIIVSKDTQSTLKSDTTIIYPYNKAICQFALEEVPVVEVVEISYEDLKEIESERGLGKIGSSGK